MENTVVAITGHNNPPSMAVVLAENLPVHHAQAMKQKNDIIAGVDRMPETIEDDATAKLATAFIKQIGDVTKENEKTRKATKDPYYQAGITVDDFFKKKLNEPLARAKTKAQSLLQPYLEKQAEIERKDQEERRKKAEEEARIAREQAAEEAAKNADSFAAEEAQIVADELEKNAEKVAKKADNHKTAVRSDIGGTASSRLVWIGEIADMKTIDLETLRPFFTADAVEKAMRGYIKSGGRNLKGARISEKNVLTVR